MQSQQSPHRTHCPAPASISNGYYLTDRQSETPLALPAVSLGGEQVKMFFMDFLVFTVLFSTANKNIGFQNNHKRNQF
jgi:hypothetical protein